MADVRPLHQGDETRQREVVAQAVRSYLPDDADLSSAELALVIERVWRAWKGWCDRASFLGSPIEFPLWLTPERKADFIRAVKVYATQCNQGFQAIVLHERVALEIGRVKAARGTPEGSHRA